MPIQLVSKMLIESSKILPSYFLSNHSINSSKISTRENEDKPSLNNVFTDSAVFLLGSRGLGKPQLI